MAAGGYVGMSVTPEARHALRMTMAEVTVRIRKNAGVSETMVALAKLAESHMDELVQIVTDMKENQ